MKELLATPDTLRITTPVLPRETMERVLEIIRKDVSTGEVRVDNPTQNLESYFLDVVQKARAAAAETSGAQSGARVAAYLRGGAEAKPATEKVLERLTLPQAAQPSAPNAAPRRRAESGREKTGGVDANRPSRRRQPAKPADAGSEAGGFVEGGRKTVVAAGETEMILTTDADGFQNARDEFLRKNLRFRVLSVVV